MSYLKFNKPKYSLKDRDLEKTGATFEASVFLKADPVQDLEAATKHYVDVEVSKRLPISGGTMTGSLILKDDPQQGLEAATKRYVDTNVALCIKKIGDEVTGNLKFTQHNTGITWERNTDFASIKFYNTSNTDNDSRLEFQIGDDHNEYFRWTSVDPSRTVTTELMTLRPNDISSGLRYRGNKVWHEGNDGHGTGLDADTLDNYHASDFSFRTLSNVNSSTILSKIKEVDGEGSGLNADKLDGWEYSELVKRTVYVDQLNGDDNNDGITLLTPVKTLSKAVTLCPGTGNSTSTIILLSDYHHDSSAIEVNGKNIIFDLNGKSLRVSSYVFTVTYNDGSTADFRVLRLFVLIDARLWFYIGRPYTNTGGGIILEDIPTDYPVLDTYNGFVSVLSSCFYGGLRISVFNKNRDTDFFYAGKGVKVLNLRQWSTYRPNHVFFGLSGHYNQGSTYKGRFVLHPEATLADFKTTPGELYIETDFRITDPSNNDIDVKTKIMGVVKDATTGLPLNINSNIPL